MTKPPLHSFWTDGITVWVNGGGGLIGRFGRQGVDIHQPMSEQQTHGECLFCTHGPTTPADWDTFVEKMLELHQIKVSAKFKPKRFR